MQSAGSCRLNFNGIILDWPPLIYVSAFIVSSLPASVPKLRRAVHIFGFLTNYLSLLCYISIKNV